MCILKERVIIIWGFMHPEPDHQVPELPRDIHAIATSAMGTSIIPPTYHNILKNK